MMINKDNYEIYAIDYIEGNLDQKTVQVMEEFLQRNPSVQAELEGMMDPIIVVADESIVYEYKELLKKKEDKKRAWMPLLMKVAAALVLLLATTFTLDLAMDNVNTDASVAVIPQTEVTTPSTAEVPIIETESARSPEEDVETRDSSVKRPVPKARSTTKVKTNTSTNNITRNDETIPSTPIERIEPNTTLTIAEATTNFVTSNTSVEASPATRKQEMIEVIDIIEVQSPLLSGDDIQSSIAMISPRQISIEKKTNKPKRSWILDAITKKSDGTNVFAFEGVKRALTPTRLRDAEVDQASTDSPLKQFTDDY